VIAPSAKSIPDPINPGTTAVGIKEKVLEVLSSEGHPLNAGKIAELGGLDREEGDKAMAQLKKDGKIVSPKRCYRIPA
jgi:hypothetical protein